MKAAALIAIVILVIFCAIAGVYFLAGFETNEIKHLQEQNQQLQEQIEQLQGELQSKSLEIQTSQARIAELQDQALGQQARMAELERENREMNDVVSRAANIIRQNQAAAPSCPPAQTLATENAGLNPTLAAAVSGAIVLLSINAWFFRKNPSKIKAADANTVWVRMSRQQAAGYARNRRRE